MGSYSVSVVYTIYSSLDSVERVLSQAVVTIYYCNYNVKFTYLLIFIFINRSTYVQKL